MLKAILVAVVVAFYGGRHFSIPVIGSILSSIIFFALELLCYIIFKVQIYPYYLSPLRHLPSPEVTQRDIVLIYGDKALANICAGG